jgi:hypothetical protein
MTAKTKVQSNSYTRKQMVDLANAQGFSSATERLHADWVVKGLLGHGRGGWSIQQLELWLALLKLHQQIHALDALCNVPIFLWLYVGKKADVSLDQTRRAMETWAKANSKSRSEKAAKRASHQLLRSLGLPQIPGKREIVKTLTQMHFDGAFDKEELRYLLQGGLEWLQRRENDPALKELLTPDLVYTHLVGRQGAMTEVYQIEEVIWEWARTLTLMQAGERQLEAPQTLGKLMFSSCANLITGLGIAHSMTQLGSQGGLSWLMNPKHWMEGKMAASITTRFEISPLALPLDGVPSFSIEIIFASPQVHPDLLR